jgi:photosystem II stability/assembly factor-like uncharacterized protein
VLAAAGKQIVRLDSGGRFVVAKMVPPSKGLVTHIAFGADRVGVATTADGAMYRTSDGGGYWSRVVENAPKPMLGVTFVGARSVVAVGTYNDSTAVFRSADGGLTWSKTPSGGPVMSFAVASFGARFTVAVGSAGTVLRGVDDGRAWTYVRHGLTHTMLYDAAIADSTTAIVVGNDGTVLRSSDGGYRWMRVPTPTSMHLMSVAFADDRRGAAVGFGGVVLVTEDAGLTWRRVSTSVPHTLVTVLWRGPNEFLAAGQGGIVLRVAWSVTAPHRTAGVTAASTNLIPDRARHD